MYINTHDPTWCPAEVLRIRWIFQRVYAHNTGFILVVEIVYHMIIKKINITVYTYMIQKQLQKDHYKQGSSTALLFPGSLPSQAQTSIMAIMFLQTLFGHLQDLHKSCNLNYGFVWMFECRKCTYSNIIIIVLIHHSFQNF